MLEVEPTSIHSLSQKGLHTQHPRLSRSRRDTPSVGSVKGRSPAPTGTGKMRRQQSFAGMRSNREVWRLWHRRALFRWL